MRKAKIQTGENRRYFLPFCVVGIAGLLLFLAWFASGSTAYAQPNAEEHEGSGEQHEEPEVLPEQPEGNSGPGPQIEGLACMTQILGRVPSGPQDFTSEERLRIVQECFGGSALT